MWFAANRVINKWFLTVTPYIAVDPTCVFVEYSRYFSSRVRYDIFSFTTIIPALVREYITLRVFRRKP